MLDKKKVCDAGHFICLTKEILMREILHASQRKSL